MAAADAGAFRTGDTVLIVKVPDADLAVAHWRSRFDPAATAGVPAHITVLAPFLPRRFVDATVEGELGALIGAHQAFDVELGQCRRFPGVLYLAPEPDAGFRALTGAVASRWPEAPPYGGQFADVVPHLTIAHGQDDEVLDLIESEVRGRLPIRARIESVQLMAYAGDRWSDVRSFELAATDAGATG